MFLCTKVFTDKVKKGTESDSLKAVIDGRRHIQIQYHLENELASLVKQQKNAVCKSEEDYFDEKIEVVRQLIAEFQEQQREYLIETQAA